MSMEHVRFNGALAFNGSKIPYVPNPDTIKYIGELDPELDTKWDELEKGEVDSSFLLQNTNVSKGRYIVITASEAHNAWGKDIDQYWDSKRGGYVAV
jgi:hypothetical protein